MAEKNGHRRIRGYSDLTLDIVRERFGVEPVNRPLFPPVEEAEVKEWLLTALEEGRDLAIVSEKARSEFVVAPILAYLRSLVSDRISIFSGVRFDVDPKAGLKGVCDFIITAKPSIPLLLAPTLVIVEAKKHDIEEGIGQCAGAMIAAQLFNERNGSPTEQAFGCVTNGGTWQFLKLDRQNILTIDSEQIFLSQLRLLLGKLRWIVEQGLKEFAGKENLK
jgi:hypothetical protein